MPTYQIVTDQVNGEINKELFYVTAEDKIDCADQVNARYNNPKTIMYSMYELDDIQNMERLASQLYYLDGAAALDFTNSLFKA